MDSEASDPPAEGIPGRANPVMAGFRAAEVRSSRPGEGVNWRESWKPRQHCLCASHNTTCRKYRPGAITDSLSDCHPYSYCPSSSIPQIVITLTLAPVIILILLPLRMAANWKIGSKPENASKRQAGSLRIRDRQ